MQTCYRCMGHKVRVAYVIEAGSHNEKDNPGMNCMLVCVPCEKEFESVRHPDGKPSTGNPAWMACLSREELSNLGVDPKKLETITLAESGL